MSCDPHPSIFVRFRQGWGRVGGSKRGDKRSKFIRKRRGGVREACELNFFFLEIYSVGYREIWSNYIFRNIVRNGKFVFFRDIFRVHARWQANVILETWWVIGLLHLSVITGLFYCVRLRGSVLFYLSRRNCLIFYLPGLFFIPVSILLIVERICRPIFQFFVTNPILFHFFVLGINYIVWTMDISFYFDRYI